MATQKSSGTRVPATSSTLTIGRLLDAPLPELLATSGAEIIDSSITDAEFYGAAIQHRSGRIHLHLPADRSAQERDLMVRTLVGRLLVARHGGSQ
ncbi:hypothetical protein [Streptomyces sp. NPDC013489]|uniref:hypothetical protein n=1 Tax=Streptomyces sp. NPDC013489 TaxID=3155606 RepID=UPI0033F31F6A